MNVAMIFCTKNPVPVARSYNQLQDGSESFTKELLFLQCVTAKQSLRLIGTSPFLFRSCHALVTLV